MKYITEFILFISLLISCDYWGDYEYKIRNDSQKDIQIKIFVDYWFPSESRLDSFNIEPSETKLIRVTPSENLGRNEDPHGVYDTEIIRLGDFIIYYEGIKVNQSFKDIKYWSYNVTGDQVGTYLMILSDSILTSGN